MNLPFGIASTCFNMVLMLLSSCSVGHFRAMSSLTEFRETLHTCSTSEEKHFSYLRAALFLNPGECDCTRLYIAANSLFF